MSLDHSHAFSLRMHTILCRRLDESVLAEWTGTILANIDRMLKTVSGETHRQSLQAWRSLVLSRDIDGLNAAMMGTGNYGIQMREMGPFLGIITDLERAEALQPSKILRKLDEGEAQQLGR